MHVTDRRLTREKDRCTLIDSRESRVASVVGSATCTNNINSLASIALFFSPWREWRVCVHTRRCVFTHCRMYLQPHSTHSHSHAHSHTHGECVCIHVDVYLRTAACTSNHTPLTLTHTLSLSLTIAFSHMMLTHSRGSVSATEVVSANK